MHETNHLMRRTVNSHKLIGIVNGFVANRSVSLLLSHWQRFFFSRTNVECFLYLAAHLFRFHLIKTILRWTLFTLNRSFFKTPIPNANLFEIRIFCNITKCKHFQWFTWMRCCRCCCCCFFCSRVRFHVDEQKWRCFTCQCIGNVLIRIVFNNCWYNVYSILSSSKIICVWI